MGVGLVQDETGKITINAKDNLDQIQLMAEGQSCKSKDRVATDK